MKIFYTILFPLIIFTSISFAKNCEAQWVQTNGPNGCNIRNFMVSGTNLFEGTWGGVVFMSSNNGVNRTSVNNGLCNKSISALAVFGSRLFAERYRGVSLSTVKGELKSGKYEYTMTSVNIPSRVYFCRLET